MSFRSTAGRGARSKRILAVVVGLASVAVATGCVLDITAEVGGAQPVTVNDRGVFLAWNDARQWVRIEQGGATTTLGTIPGMNQHAAEYLNNDGYAAGWAGFTAPDNSSSTAFPVVWTPNGTPIDLRPSLAGGDHPRFAAYPLGFTDTGKLLGYVNYRAGATSSTHVRQTFVWDLATRTTTYLPARAVGGTIASINDRGVVVGYMDGRSFRLTPEPDGSYTDAGWEELPIFPLDLNNGGDIVGTFGPEHRAAVLPEGKTTPELLGDPGLPAGDLGPKYFINDQGTVVIARRLDPGMPAGQPVRYSATDRLTPVRFPGLDGSTEATIVALNNNGRAIGYARSAGGANRPFSWT